MIVRTQDGATYRLQYHGIRNQALMVIRDGGTDDQPGSRTPMVARKWYRVEVLTPLPPKHGSKLAMVLDPLTGEPNPVVRYTAAVLSIEGELEVSRALTG